MLLRGSVAPKPSRCTATAVLMRSQNVARARFRAFLPLPAPETVTDVPVKAGKHLSGIRAVAVVIRPSAQDGVDLSELLAKTDTGCLSSGQLLDFATQVSGLCF